MASSAVSILVLVAGCASEGPGASIDMGPGDGPVEGGATLIGPGGGTVEGNGATLTIPEGALATPTEITIVVASDQATPEGFTSASTIYEFLPAGLTFAMPVDARIDFTGSSQGIELIWSTASGDGFESRGGSIDGSAVIGQIDHFSRGFAGAPVPCGGNCAPGQVCQAGVCVSATPTTQCSDGIDNDNDGLTDTADSDCSGPSDDLEALPPTLPPSTNLTGTIFEPTSSSWIPLAGVTVYIHQPNQWVKTTTTDSNGRYAATIVAGEFSLQANKTDYEMPCAAQGTVTSNTVTTKNIELYSHARLTAGATPPANTSPVIVGTVSKNGAPVPGATVDVVDALDMPLAYTITDSQGHYFVCRVPDFQSLVAFKGASTSSYYDIGDATDRTVNLTLP